MLPGYGLGRAGWVSMSWDAGDGDVPVDLLLELIDESYRTVAPRTLVAQLDAHGSAQPRRSQGHDPASSS